MVCCSSVPQLVCPREPSNWVGARLLANLGRLPLAKLIRGSLPEELDARYERGCAELASLPIMSFPAAGRAFTPETDPYQLSSPPPAAVVLDDADLIGGATPAAIAGYAAAGISAILTLPRDQVVHSDGDEAPLDPAWGRVCDVILEVRHRGLPPIEGPSHLATDRSRAASRPGEAELVIHRHRWGQARTVAALFQGHYARFVDVQP